MSEDTLGYQDTPMLPGSSFHVHDGLRPQPPIVTAGQGFAAPSDATVLFDGSSLDGWEDLQGNPAAWKMENGYMEVAPKSGNIRTKSQFGSIQLHLEFASPTTVKGDGQGRGNSGVFLMGMYEIQVLDGYDNPTYPDGTVGGIYGQYPPMVNPVRKPGEWNIYDIVWEAPVFEGDTVVKKAFVTVILNNVLLHHRRELLGKTDHKAVPRYVAHPAQGPLMLQDHGDLVRFRNIWIRNLA